jgi:DNA polymerase-3 subunit alpha
MDDKKTFSLLRKGDTGGVFQLESDGMKDLLRKLAPESFSDIMAVLALYRPGPLGGFNKDKLIKRRHKEELIEYLHPNLEPILKETYGIILYQEQVMQLANVVAGFSLGEADILRRAMGKKMLDVMDEKRKSFIDGAISRGYSEKLANKLFDLITPFAGYGFAKSHSAGYALISYETAYLKAHYPVEFMASTLTSEMDNSDKVGHFVGESKKMHIPILPPDINRSKYQFIAQDGKIRFGLGAIKNVGKKAILSMVETREKGGNFKDLPDFLMRVGSRDMNKRAMESLVKAGAFDTIDKNRKRILSILSTDKKKEMERRQMALFGAPKIEREEEKEWTLGEVLSNEKEALGFYFSGHPLERFRDEIETFGTVSTNQIQGYSPGTEVVLGGIVAKKRRKINKNGKPMVFLDFEDFEGTCEVAIFGNLTEKDWREEQPLLIKGRVSQFNDKKSIRASKTINLREVKEKLVNRVDIYINTIGLEDETLHSLKDILLSTPGDKDVLLHLIQERRVTVLRCKNLKISPKRSVIIRIRKLLGEKSVKLGGERF